MDFMIPPQIHYIWLGGKKKSKLTEICINSWKRVLAGYEIIEWNEQNIPLEQLCKKNKFLEKCIHLKLWAFASDYLRLYILYEHGGIYLDTDVEVIKPYTPLLENQLFMGYEADGFVGTAVIGAEAKNPTIRRILDFYEDEIWNVDFINNPIIFRYLLEKEPQVFADCRLYPQTYFSPYAPGEVYEGIVEKEETYSIHWYTQEWNMNRKGYVFINTKHIKSPARKIAVTCRKNIGFIKKKYLQTCTHKSPEFPA